MSAIFVEPHRSLLFTYSETVLWYGVFGVEVGIQTEKSIHLTGSGERKKGERNRLTKKVNNPDRNWARTIPTDFGFGFTLSRTRSDKTGPIGVFLNNFYKCFFFYI